MIFKKDTIEAVIKSGKLEKFQKLVNADNCNDIDADGHAPLYYAVKYAKSKIAAVLLSLGANPASGSSSPDKSVMEDVVNTFNENLLAVFLQHGESLPECIDGMSLLHYVVTHKYYCDELLMMLIAYGVDINSVDSKSDKTALAYLLSQEDFSLKALKGLLNAGADVNYASSEENRPLTVALENKALPETASIGNFSFSYVLELLMQYNLNVNYTITLFTGSTMSLAKDALQNGRIEAFILLLENGLDIEPDDVKKIEGYLDVNKFSVSQRKRMVDINKQRNLKLPLHTSFYGKDLDDRLNTMEDLDQVNASFSDMVMTTNLKLSDKIEILQDLLDKGADVNHKVSYAGYEMSVLTAVTCWNDGIDSPVALVEWLLDHDAKIECHGVSAFLWAVWYNKPEFVRLYAEKGADLLYKEEDGSTMLSKIFTISPSHDQFSSAEAKGKMIRLLFDLCQQFNFAFPLEEPFINGDAANNMTDTDILANMTIFFQGEYRKEYLDALMYCGWDINRKFKLFDPNGSVLAQYLRINKITEDDIKYLIDTYPNVDLSEPGTIDPLKEVIVNKFSPELINLFVKQTKDINKVLKRESEGWFRETRGNYLELVMEHAPQSYEKGGADGWVCEIGAALLEAGLDPNFVIKQKLPEQHMEGGVYRKEKTLLENTTEFKTINFFGLFKLLLDHGANPYVPMCFFEENFVHHLLSRTARSQDEIIEYLDELDKRGMLQIEIKTTNGATAVLYAASKCYTRLVKYLVDKGADVNVVGGFDQSYAMHRAISNWNWVSKEDRVETVKILLDGGFNIEAIDNDGYSPLMAAAGFGCLTVVEELLKHGANPNAVNKDGKAAVHFAVMDAYAYDEYPDDSDSEEPNQMNEKLKVEIIKLLVEHGADLNLIHGQGGTPIIDAVGYSYTTILRELMKLGADVNHADQYGRTPLMIASKFGHFGCVNILGMNKSMAESIKNVDNYGDNVLHYLAGRVYRDNGESSAEGEARPLTKTFMEKFEVPCVRNNYGQTPLMIAAQNGMPKVINLYLEHGNDINELDNDGNSALIYAMSYDEEMVEYEKVLETTQFLIENKIDVNITNQGGQSAIGIALDREMSEAVDMLKAAGAKENKGSMGY